MDDVTQVPGFRFASHTMAEAATGCTVILCPEGARAGVDVRGGAPATRETDLLRPEETVDVLHAVVLSGGSAFGLAAATGVAEELERAGIGLDMGVCRVPIVSSACLFDLGVGDAHRRPGAAEGAAAVREALSGEPAPLAQGNVGAGTGCSVGKMLGPDRAMKGGLGSFAIHAGEIWVGAVAAVNAIGTILDPGTRVPIAGARLDPASTHPADPAEVMAALAASPFGADGAQARQNTTVSCIVTNARLTKAQATRVAQMAADAYALAITPSHTSMDGDTVFCMASGQVEADQDGVGVLATTVLAQAIANGCRTAQGAYGLPGAADAR